MLGLLVVHLWRFMRDLLYVDNLYTTNLSMNMLLLFLGLLHSSSSCRCNRTCVSWFPFQDTWYGWEFTLTGTRC